MTNLRTYRAIPSVAASKQRESIERGREEIWSYLDILGTNRQTYGLTELFLKSLSRLKTNKNMTQWNISFKNLEHVCYYVTWTIGEEQ